MKTIVTLVTCLLVLAACMAPAAPATPTVAPIHTANPTATSEPTQPPTPTMTPTATPRATPRASTTPQASVTPGPLDTVYLELLEPIKQGAPGADFTAARLAFAASERYDPYGMQYAPLKSDMFDALDGKNYEKALELAGAIMEQYYLSPDAHIAAFAAHDALGNAAEAAFHRGILLGLVGSLEESGDGQRMETAFDVITIEEEYLMLEWLDIRDTRQQLISGDGHKYDRFQGVDSQTGKTIEVYFNVDRVFEGATRLFQ